MYRLVPYVSIHFILPQNDMKMEKNTVDLLSDRYVMFENKHVSPSFWYLHVYSHKGHSVILPANFGSQISLLQ